MWRILSTTRLFGASIPAVVLDRMRALGQDQLRHEQDERPFSDGESASPYKMSQPWVSVAIPSWNGRALLESNLPAVLEGCATLSAGCEVLVGDDGGADGTREWLQHAFPSVGCLRSDSHRGFSATCNMLARAARGRLLYLLNNDARPEARWLQPLLPYFDDERVFAVGGMEIPSSPKATLSYPRMWSRLGIHYSRYDEAPFPMRGGFPICFVSAGHSCFRRSMFLDLGGFDERFSPFYFEDHDLCMRARGRGWKILMDPASRVFHAHQGTIGTNYPSAVVKAIHWKNRFVLSRLRYSGAWPAFLRAVGIPIFLAQSIFRWRWEAVRGYAQSRQVSIPPDRAPTPERRPRSAKRMPRWPGPPPLRALAVHQSAIIGGAEHSIELWVTHAPDWLRFTVVLGDEGPLAERLRRAGVAVEILPFPPLRSAQGLRILGCVGRLAQLARRERAVLIHSNTPRTNLIAAPAARLAGVPVIWHARNLIYGQMRDTDRLFSRLPHRILAISKAVESRFHRNGTCPPHVETVVHGVDTARFSPDVSPAVFRLEHGLRENDLAVGLVGRIGVGKGHDLFLQSIRRFLDRGGRGRFFIVGGAQTEAEETIERRARQLSRTLQVDPAVTFTGFREDMPAVMAGLDVVALCTEAEPLGRVVLEAMASGRPVVASRSGGVTELVEPGVTGLMFDPGSPDALAEALLQLAAGPELRARFGRAARERAVSRFSLDRHVSRMAQIYWETITSP
ncbi:MAG: glycosyltransferase [Nitrospirae bacterium]|nr:glycosyltransferase [Nitrospirota bacterium]